MGQGREPVVSKCCYQSVCAVCVFTLNDADGVVRCPFCRAVSVSSNWDCPDREGGCLLENSNTAVGTLWLDFTFGAASVADRLGMGDHFSAASQRAREARRSARQFFETFSPPVHSSDTYLRHDLHLDRVL